MSSYSCLTPRPIRHQPSARRHPIIHTFTFQMSKPSQSSTPYHISNTVYTKKVAQILTALSIWGQYFDPRVIFGWRYTRVSTVVVEIASVGKRRVFWAILKMWMRIWSPFTNQGKKSPSLNRAWMHVRVPCSHDTICLHFIFNTIKLQWNFQVLLDCI